jgi:hypothetical protein
MQDRDMQARLGFTVFAAGLAAALSGCTTDDKVGSMLSDPGRYVSYSCPHIVAAMRTTMIRMRELELLMAKAGTEAAGRLVSATTYRPEYLSLRGDLNVLKQTAAAKLCDVSKIDVRADTVAPARPAATAGKKSKPAQAPATAR